MKSVDQVWLIAAGTVRASGRSRTMRFFGLRRSSSQISSGPKNAEQVGGGLPDPRSKSVFPLCATVANEKFLNNQWPEEMPADH
jgi:hypothetical protein